MKKLLISAVTGIALVLTGCNTTSPPPSEGQTREGYATYDRSTVLSESEQFFGEASAGLADVINKVFTDQGRPQAYIAGEEASGAIGVGLRYGRGYLYRPGAQPVEVFWTGPSIGFDAGGNASKVFTLVYDLGPTSEMFKRYPGVDGSAYIVGGAGVNYQRNGGTVLAPVRTGVGLRTGINIGYLNYTRDYTPIPF